MLQLFNASRTALVVLNIGAFSAIAADLYTRYFLSYDTIILSPRDSRVPDRSFRTSCSIPVPFLVNGLTPS